MGIYIKGMKMPSCCMFCPISNASGCGMMNPPVLMTSKEMLADRPDWCPLVPVPPHGRLIDADEAISPMEKTFEDFDETFKGFPKPERKFVKGIQNGFIKYIKDQPTVIPAEEEQ